jgi:hypothetical protein
VSIFQRYQPQAIRGALRTASPCPWQQNIAPHGNPHYCASMSREAPFPAGTSNSRAHIFRLVPFVVFLAVMFTLAPLSRADVIEMYNGDRYNGKILTLNSNSLVLESEILGKITLPRSKVAQINFYAGTTPDVRSTAPTVLGTPRLPAVTKTNRSSDFSAAMRELGAQTNLIQQVKSEFLAGAGPEANNKFDELLDGLISGRVTIGDLRNEAKTAADQIRALQKDLGPEADDYLSGYLTILDHFLRETASENTSTNTPRR